MKKKVIAAILCLACLPVMPLGASAEVLHEEEQVTGRYDAHMDQTYYDHYYQLETDSFSYEQYNYCVGLLETDVIDANYLVTGVFYQNGQDEPFLYTMNGLTEFGEFSIRCKAKTIEPYLNGETLEVGDLLYVYGDGAVEVSPPIMFFSDKVDVVVKNYGNGVDIFGDDFKKVLYWELYLSPMVQTDEGVVFDCDYAKKIYDKGNLNNDDSIDLMDVITLNKNLMTGYSISSYAKGCADVDNNGVVDAVDSLNILKYVVGLIDSFDELQ